MACIVTEDTLTTAIQNCSCKLALYDPCSGKCHTGAIVWNISSVGQNNLPLTYIFSLGYWFRCWWFWWLFFELLSLSIPKLAFEVERFDVIKYFVVWFTRRPAPVSWICTLCQWLLWSAPWPGLLYCHWTFWSIVECLSSFAQRSLYLFCRKCGRNAMSAASVWSCFIQRSSLKSMEIRQCRCSVQS